MKKRSLLAKGKTAPKTVDQYLAGVPEHARSTLEKIRAVVRSAVPPEATETISYGMPTFKYKGSLIWFAAFSVTIPGLANVATRASLRIPSRRRNILLPMFVQFL